MRVKKAFVNFMFWVLVAIIINIVFYYFMGKEVAIQFLGGYIIEMSLSVDNLFLFLMVFTAFNVREEAERRALNYGIFVAMGLRMIFIFLGVRIVESFHGVLYIFGIILFISGLKMIFSDENHSDVGNSLIIKFLKNFIPFTDRFQKDKFFVRRGGQLLATPLLAVLIVIEASDILFAIDSIPAIFSITTNPIIIYTSNICAIICLRSMYFLLARLNHMFKYVKYGVILILIFTGVKLMILYFNINISVLVSVLIICIILLSSILMSFIFE